MRLTVEFEGDPEAETVYDGPDAALMGDALTVYVDANTSESYARKVKRWWTGTAYPKVLNGQEPELRLANGSGVDVWKTYQN